jgi:hypothetical protein
MYMYEAMFCGFRVPVFSRYLRNYPFMVARHGHRYRALVPCPAVPCPGCLLASTVVFIGTLSRTRVVLLCLNLVGLFGTMRVFRFICERAVLAARSPSHTPSHVQLHSQRAWFSRRLRRPTASMIAGLMQNE